MTSPQQGNHRPGPSDSSGFCQGAELASARGGGRWWRRTLASETGSRLRGGLRYLPLDETDTATIVFLTVAIREALAFGKAV